MKLANMRAQDLELRERAAGPHAFQLNTPGLAVDGEIVRRCFLCGGPETDPRHASGSSR